MRCHFAHVRVRLLAVQRGVPELVVPVAADGDEDVPGEEDHQTRVVREPERGMAPGNKGEKYILIPLAVFPRCVC